MAYERLGLGSLDYFPCRYGTSKQMFRGPPTELKGPYVAVVGGTEAYGKFVEDPFPAMLARLLGMPVVNLGCMNGGVDSFAGDPVVLSICKGSALTIVQITGAQNISNRFYSVHPRRNDRFLGVSPDLVRPFPSLDLTDVHFTQHLLNAISARSTEMLSLVTDELKVSWTRSMTGALRQVGGKIILLWMADTTPEVGVTSIRPGRRPMFVDRNMLATLQPGVHCIVEHVATPEELDAGQERMIYTALEEPAAGAMLGPVVHEAVALRLSDVIGPLLRNENGPP